jgi:hypothetical protein
MDTYNVALFGLIGLVVALILTGGLVSMIFGEEPSLGQLGAGAAAGAAAGGALGFTGLTGLTLPTDMGKLLESLQTESEPEMKTGLPTF